MMAPFDPIRGVFWLLAAVVAATIVVGIMQATACAWRLVTLGETCKPAGISDFMLELLAVCMLLINAKPPEGRT